MDADLLKLLADYALAGVFIVLFVRSQMELVKVHREFSEQRREENREMRNLLFELARRGVGGNPLEDTQTRRAYKSTVEKG